MPSFLNSTELKRLEVASAEIVIRASHELIAEVYIEILNPQHLPYPVH